MKSIIDIFGEIVPLLKKEKKLIVLSLIPIFIGSIIYSTIGYYLYFDTLPWLKTILKSYIDGPDMGIALSYLLTVIVSIFFYVILNWTFVLLVSIISSPFNDYICQVVHKHYQVKDELSSFNLSAIKHVLVNEIKKIALILFVSFFLLLLGFLPFLTPLSFVLTGLLLSVSFLDYSWSIKKYSFSECIRFLKENIWIMIVVGLMFLFLLSVPFLNLFVFPYAVIFYSILFAKREGNKL